MNRSDEIALYRGRDYRNIVNLFPSWMNLIREDDPINSLLTILGTEQFLAKDRLRGDIRNWFLPTGNLAMPEYLYETDLDANYQTSDILSGDYETSLYSGGARLTQMAARDLHAGRITRATLDSQYDISGLPSGTLSGEGLSFVQQSPYSGQYYLSFYGDPYLYTANYDDTTIYASGDYHTRNAREYVDFLPLSGEWSEYFLTHSGTLPDLVDIYNLGGTLSGALIDGSRIYSQHLDWFGRLLAQYDYTTHENISRISSENYIWNILSFIRRPSMLVDPPEGIYDTIPLSRTKTPFSGTIAFSTECLDLMPGEMVDLTFTFPSYHHQEEPLSGTYFYESTSGEIDKNSVRIFNGNPTEGRPVYYNPSTGNLYNYPLGSLTTLYPVEDYTATGGGGFVEIFNPSTLSGTFHVIYHTKDTKVYECHSRQSYVPSESIVWSPYWKDYRVEDNTLIPMSIIELEETDVALLSLLRSSPLDSFSAHARRGRRGLCWDPDLENFWILQSNDILHNIAGDKSHAVNVGRGDFCYLLDNSPHPGWESLGGFYGRRYPILDFQRGDILLRSMCLYDNRLVVLGEKNNTLYLLFLERSDPSSQYVLTLEGATP